MSAITLLITISQRQESENAPSDTNDNPSTTASSNAAGAAGTDTGSFGTISKGGLIAVVVIVSAVVIFAVVSSILFYLAKKRSWEVCASLRRLPAKVKTALTPRRSEFPRSIKEDMNAPGRNEGHVRVRDEAAMASVAGFDIEKEGGRMSSYEMTDLGKPKAAKAVQDWARRLRH